MTIAPFVKQPGWERRLEALFVRRRATPFDWTENNCVSFAAEATAALTGELVRFPVDPATASAAEAERRLEKLGGLASATTLVLGEPKRGWKLASRGSIALVDRDGRPLLTVCTGRSLCAPGPEGLAHFPLMAATMVWTVG